MGQNGGVVSTVGPLALAMVTILILGAYVLGYPQTDLAKAAIGALISIASAAGGYYFHAQQASFFGASLAMQRDAFVQALQANVLPAVKVVGMATPTPTPNAPTGPSATTPTTPNDTFTNPPTTTTETPATG